VDYRALAGLRSRQDQSNHAVDESVTADYCFLMTEDDVPSTIEEAKATAEWPEWKKAIDEEMSQLETKGTWTMAELPPDRKAIGCRWVFARKYDENGKVVKHKGRLVAQGFSQKPGIDYTHTYSPVVRLDSLCTVIVLATQQKMHLGQMDVTGAYLNGKLDEEIYMRQAPGFDNGTNQVYLLKKVLYGLKQAGHLWNKKLHEAVSQLGFQRSKVEPCVYIHHIGDRLAIFTVWVDDFLIATNDTREMTRVKEALKQEFNVKDLGSPRYLVGIKISCRPDGSTALSQSSYIETILKRTHMENANPVLTPLDPNVKLEKNTGNPVDPAQYATAIGSLMYAAIGTRPDIAYAVQLLSQFTANPSTMHWTAVKHVMRYLSSTRDYALVYGGPGNFSTTFTAFSDADWGSDQDDRKSISGNTFLLAGGAISWASKKQSLTALSTCEAEFTAANLALRQVVWLRQLLSDLGFRQAKPSVLYCDNQAAIMLSLDQQFHARTKHFDIQTHFLRDKVDDKTVTLEYCPTSEMVADVLTKALGRQKFRGFVSDLGLLAG
jgi:hypothetical protein